MVEEESNDETSGGIVICSPEFYNEIGEFSELFSHKAKLSEAARFAMAIGIRTGGREPQEIWKKKGKKRTIAHLNGTFADNGRYDFEALFEMLELIEADDETPLNLVISEYITGGMRWIVENEMLDGSNFSVLKEEFSDLFSESD